MRSLLYLAHFVLAKYLVEWPVLLEELFVADRGGSRVDTFPVTRPPGLLLSLTEDLLGILRKILPEIFLVHDFG